MPKAVTAYALPRYRQDALTPEVVDPRIADVEALARWLDYAFALPGGFRFGDLFDIAFKANRRNYQALKSHLSHSHRQIARDWLFLIVTGLIVAGTIALPVVAVIELARHLGFR